MCKSLKGRVREWEKNDNLNGITECDFFGDILRCTACHVNLFLIFYLS